MASTTPSVTPSRTPQQQFILCTLCNLQLSGATGGYFLTSNKIISYGSVCIIDDYVVEWRTGSVTGSTELISGRGSDPDIQVQHPFTNEVVPQGSYYPVIRYIQLNGTTYTPYLAMATGSTLWSPDLLTCVNASPIVITPITCSATLNSDGVYPFVLTYRNTLNTSEDKSRTLTFDLLNTTKYFAWEFAAYDVADQFKISYCTVSDPVGVLVDNFIVGTRSSGGTPNSLVTNLYPASYPTNPKVYNYSSYMNGAYGVKYISVLTGFTYASGDYLKLDVIGSVYEPTNNDTNWDMKMKCFTVTDILTGSTFPNTSISKILTGTTVMAYSGDPNCYFDVYYNTVSGLTATATGYKPSSEYFLWKYTDMFKIAYYNKVYNYGQNPVHITNQWKDISSSQWLWNGSIYQCANLATPSDTATVTPNSTTGVTLSFTSSVDYNKFVSNIASVTGSTGYAQYLVSGPTDLAYYGYYFVSWVYAPANCGDSVVRNYLYIGLGSQIILDSGAKTIKFIYSIPNNGMPTGVTCSESWQGAQNYITNMRYTTGNTIGSSYRTTHVRDIDPVAALRPYPVTTHETVRTLQWYIYIKADVSGSNGMINRLFDPAAMGFMYNSFYKQWELYIQWDRLTLTGTTPPTTTWTLKRQKFLRTDNPSDYFNLADSINVEANWEIVNSG